MEQGVARALVAATICAFVAVAGGAGCVSSAAPPASTPSAPSSPSSSASRHPAGPSGSATKNVDGGLRSDPDPLVSRFPAIGTPRSVSWASGTTGDPRAPGPSTYWIDAVLEMAPEQAATMRAATGSTSGSLPAGSVPELVPIVAAGLPDGEWLTSPALDELLAIDGWEVHGYLAADTDTLVISGIGDR